MNTRVIERADGGADKKDEGFVTRSFSIERLRDEAKKQTTYRVSLSSETPVRDFPWAPPVVLVHSKSAVDLGGIDERGIPLFVNHQHRDLGSLVGRLVNLRLDGKRTVGELRFSEANPQAVLVRGMVDEGTLTDMSVGAERIEYEAVRDQNNNVTLIRWTKWIPREATIAGLGADRSVGIGRSVEVGVQVQVNRSADAEGASMDEQERLAAEAKAKAERDAAAKIDAGKQQHDKEFAERSEKERIATIRKYGQANAISEDVVQSWIGRASSWDQIADDILKIHAERAKAGTGNNSVSALDLTDKQKKQYSLTRAILAAHSEKWEENGAGFELECHKEIAERLNKIPEKGHFFVPQDIQRRHMEVDLLALAQRMGLPYLSRDLNAADGGAGGFLVGTRVMGFDEIMRNTSVFMRMGATSLPGLRDNVTIPRQSAAATAEWLTQETSGATESQQAFVQLALAPKTVSAYTEVSRKLLLQSSIGVESMVNADLGAVVGLAADLAGLSGTGASGQPLGIDNVSGIGSVTGTSLAFDDILEFQTDVAGGNIMPARGGYVTTPAVASLCIQRVKYASTASPLWEGNIWNGQMQGFPAMSSNQVAAAVMYFGDWSKIVVAEWGTLEIDTNPYASFAAGIIGVRAIYSLDIGVRYPAAFSRAASIT